MSSPLIGVLALQGAFREHCKLLESMNVKTREIRQSKDIKDIQGIILPGGESTTIGKLLVDLDIMEPLKEKLKEGLPAFGTCAGMILLCDHIENSTQPRLGGLDAVVRRNAFGRQVDSFETDLKLSFDNNEPFPAIFIRAPVIVETGKNVEVLGAIPQDDSMRPVAVRQGNLLATSFHPELTNDRRVHEYFMKMF